MTKRPAKLLFFQKFERVPIKELRNLLPNLNSLRQYNQQLTDGRSGSREPGAQIVRRCPQEGCLRSKILYAWLILMGTAVGVQAEEWTKTYPVTGKPEVRVTLDDGPIHVSTSNEGGVKATVSTCGYRIGPHDVRVEENQSGNRIEIAVKVPPG